MGKGSMFRSSGDLNGFLDAGSHIKGELNFEDTFRIDGRLTGSVVSDGELIVGEGGDVDGEVNVRRVFVSGTVRGTLRASERVTIVASGKVFADIEAPSLKIEDGALFEGRCTMERHPSSSASSKPHKVTQMPLAKG